MKKRLFASIILAAVFIMTAPPIKNHAPVPQPTETVFAANGISFDAQTGVLTLSGTVEKDSIRAIGYKSKVVSIVALEGTKFSSSYAWLFEDFVNCESIDLSLAAKQTPTSTCKMFNRCEKLTTLKLGDFDTSRVSDMSYMFYGCKNLTTLNLDNFDTSNVNNMEYMFEDCEKLTSLDLSGFNTKKVKAMNSMFFGCSSLENVNLSSFDTPKLESMRHMFYGCKSLKSIDISGFNTSKQSCWDS